MDVQYSTYNIDKQRQETSQETRRKTEIKTQLRERLFWQWLVNFKPHAHARQTYWTLQTGARHEFGNGNIQNKRLKLEGQVDQIMLAWIR